MELSLVLNNECSFTGKEEEYLIGFSCNGERVLFSRECLEIALRMLNAVENKSDNNTSLVDYNCCATASIKVDDSNINFTEAEITIPKKVPKSMPSQSQPIQHKPVKKSINKNHAIIFFNSLNKFKKEFCQEHEDRPDDGTYNGLMMKNAIKECGKSIDKETMFKVLNKVSGLARENFEALYETSK